MPLTRGTLLGPYEIAEVLGAGGMGEVYRARDTRLDRNVAIKALPDAFAQDRDRLARFQREAQLLAKLNHPNIAGIHGIEESGGSLYLVLEYVPGQTLAERIEAGTFTTSEAVRISQQLVDALIAAHEKGIIHRDLKPANVKITPEGKVKVLDFGLARRLPDASLNQATLSRLSVEEQNTITGTLQYMAPECLRGEPADQRSDIWAVGVVLHEMLCGRLPFGGKTPYELTSAILSSQPSALPGSAPAAVRSTVARCLDKQPSQRYQTARELAAALETVRIASPGASGDVPTVFNVPEKPRKALWILAGALMLALVIGALLLRNRAKPNLPPEVPIQSLAVLPLANASGDPANDSLADGLTEAFVAGLAGVHELRVSSSNSVLRYKGTRKPLAEIARELAVDGIVQGSLRRTGESVQISAELVRAGTGERLWQDSFSRDVHSVLSVRDDVTTAIARVLHVTSATGQPGHVSRTWPVQPAAFDLYVRGSFYAAHENKDDNAKAIELLEKSVAADPDFPPALAQLAHAYVIRAFYVSPGDQKLEENAYVALTKALTLDANSADAHYARGLYLWAPQQRFAHAAAIREYKTAISLNPSLDDAHHQLGLVYIHVGLLEEGQKEIEKAIALNPANTLARYRRGVALLYQGRFEEAQNTLGSVSSDFAPSLTAYQSAWVLHQLGRDEEAKPIVIDYLRKHPEDPGGMLTSTQAVLSAVGGENDRAEELIRRAESIGKGFGHFHHSAYNIACAYARMNRPADAVKWLQNAADTGLPNYSLFAHDPNFTPLAQFAPFTELLSTLKKQEDEFRALSTTH